MRGDSLAIVKLLIFLLAAPLWAQTMSEDDVFSELNLATPGLEKVAAAVAAGDRAAARHALAEYYRHRSKPLYYIAPGEKANPKPLRPDVARWRARPAPRIPKHRLSPHLRRGDRLALR